MTLDPDLPVHRHMIVRYILFSSPYSCLLEVFSTVCRAIVAGKGRAAGLTELVYEITTQEPGTSKDGHGMPRSGRSTSGRRTVLDDRLDVVGGFIAGDEEVVGELLGRSGLMSMSQMNWVVEIEFGLNEVRGGV
jgi:hypothetical protein